MSFRGHRCKRSSAPIYVSTVEVMLSSSRMTPPPPFESVVRDRPFQNAPASAFCLPAGQANGETTPASASSPPSSPGAYCTRLDVILAQKEPRKGLGNTNRCTEPSDVTSRWSSPPKDAQGNEYGESATWSMPASYKQHSERGKSVHQNSPVKNDPLKLAMSFPSDVLSCKSPPSCTSRLDIDLAAVPAVSTLRSRNLHGPLTPCNPVPPQQGYSQCNVQMPDLHASMKLYISTCSLTVKPFRTDSHGKNHVHSSHLMPQLEKVSKSPAGLPTGSWEPNTSLSSGGSPTLQITRFHVTSSARCPGPPQQTVSRDVWLSPAVLTGSENSASGNEVMSKDLNPELLVFQNHSSPRMQSQKTTRDGLTHAHHKVSKITLILATPWTTMPIQVVREFRRSPSPTIFIKTHDSDIAGPPLHPVGIGAGLSLSVNPVCCSGLLSTQQQWAPSSLRPSQEACAVESLCPDDLLTKIPAHTTSSIQRARERAWCPSIAVNIASLGSGRKVVKISIPF